MKATIVCFVISWAVFFGLLTQAKACGRSAGGQPAVCHTNTSPYPSYPSYPQTPPQTIPQPEQLPLPPQGPITSNFASPVAPPALSARLSVVPATSDSAVKASAVSVPTATIREIIITEKAKDTTTAPKIDTDAIKTAAATPVPVAPIVPPVVPTVEPSKIADEIKGLVGKWMAVGRHEGELTTIELQLDDRGWAKLTVPGADGKPSTTERKVEFENDELKLIGSNGELSLGKLVEFDSRQMVLDRAGGQVTFVRP